VFLANKSKIKNFNQAHPTMQQAIREGPHQGVQAMLPTGTGSQTGISILFLVIFRSENIFL